MKKSVFYPAIFERDGDYIMVSFPDLPGCNTQGDNMVEAYKYAKEVLALHLDDFENPPAPSDIESAVFPADTRVMLVEADCYVVGL